MPEELAHDERRLMNLQEIVCRHARIFGLLCLLLASGASIGAERSSTPAVTEQLMAQLRAGGHDTTCLEVDRDRASEKYHVTARSGEACENEYEMVTCGTGEETLVTGCWEWLIRSRERLRPLQRLVLSFARERIKGAVRLEAEIGAGLDGRRDEWKVWADHVLADRTWSADKWWIIRVREYPDHYIVRLWTKSPEWSKSSGTEVDEAGNVRGYIVLGDVDDVVAPPVAVFKEHDVEAWRRTWGDKRKANSDR